MATPIKKGKLTHNRTTVRLPDDVRDGLVGFSTEQHRTVTDVVCEALKLYLRSPERFFGRGQDSF